MRLHLMNETQTSIRIYEWNQHVSTFSGNVG